MSFLFFSFSSGLIVCLSVFVCVTAAKKVLIVYAHQSANSFNAAAKDAAVAALTAQGCTVDVSDLYAMKFKAAATAEDITGKQMPSWRRVFGVFPVRPTATVFGVFSGGQESPTLPLRRGDQAGMGGRETGC